MFSGIIEKIGTVKSLVREGSNLHIEVEAIFENPIYIDQSIAHNGVCLTVVKITGKSYVVTAIEETLKLTNLGSLKVGEKLNIEISITADKLLDGHIVQGHVDTTTEVKHIEEVDGSWYFTFKLPKDHASLVVSKGSICINGVSLTVVEPTEETFKVAIIPYTYEHTNFHSFGIGTQVNLEFDIIGKYVLRQMQAYQK